MKIFIDTANVTDIEAGLKRGFASGITTNPALLAKEPKSSFETHIQKIIELINRYQPGIPLSVEVFSCDPAEIVRQAKEFVQKFNYRELCIKIQIGWDELAIIKELAAEGMAVNCTCCMTVTQALMAARAGAKYVSLFWGRIRDAGAAPEAEQLKQKKALDAEDFNPAAVVRSVRELIDKNSLECEIIAGSIRSVTDVRDAALAGAHIVTVPPKFFPDMITHFKTDEVVNQFLKDFKQWIS